MFLQSQPDIIIKHAKWQTEETILLGDILIQNGKIVELSDRIATRKKTIVIDVQNHFIYPGLINAHDHLEMNLYPKLGKPPYSNYVDWAREIYQPNVSPIREIEKVDIRDRLLWGGLKNLIAGATTVIHHNPWDRVLSSEKFPVKVLKKMNWAHSLKLGKNIAKSFPKNSNIPFVLHAAEGIDSLASGEIAELYGSGLLQKSTVLIHGIGISEQNINLVEKKGSALVWCPSSNFFMFDKTASIDKLKNKIPIMLGTDSTLTGSPTLLDEMCLAVESGLASKPEIYSMVSNTAQVVFKLEPTAIQVGRPADIFCLPIKKANYIENLFANDAGGISFVIVNGIPKLLDSSLTASIKNLKFKINVLGNTKAINLDVGSLKNRIERIVPKQYLEKNTLWTMII